MAKLTVPIAGHRYYPEGRAILDQLKPGTGLRLVRDPKNPFDELAVEVWFSDTKLGFVPRANNCDIAWLLDGGQPIVAVFTGLQEERTPVMMLMWP